MIKGKELRRGNKFVSLFGNTETVLSILDNTNNGKIKVIEKPGLTDSDVHYKSQHHKDMYSELILCEENGNQYKPVEVHGLKITEDILLKNKFAITFKNDFTIDYVRDNLKIRYKTDNNKFMIAIWNDESEENKNDCALIFLDHFHDVQNIYYMIHKKDFEVKL